MKGMALSNFFSMRPKLPFRFKVTFYTGLNNLADDLLTYCVTSVTMPKLEGQVSEGSIYFGNTSFTIPTWNPASRKIDITFEENDQMLVSQFIHRLIDESWSKSPYKITIVVHEFEEHMRNDYKSDTESTAYVCHLSSYDEPAFKRDGQAAQVTMNASFIIDTIIPNWDYTNPQVFNGSNIKEKQARDKFNPAIKNLIVDIENTKFTYGKFGNIQELSDDITVDVSDRKFNSGFKTSDFVVDPLETDAAFEKIKAAKPKSSVTREQLQKVQEENNRRMKKAFTKFEELLGQHGLKVSVNTYNDANHKIGLGSDKGSHLLNSKIDLDFLNQNDESVAPQDFDDETIDIILNAAKEAGLVANWETSGKKINKDRMSGWGDFVLKDAQTLTADNVIREMEMSSWTGQRQMYNTSNKSKIMMGRGNQNAKGKKK